MGQPESAVRFRACPLCEARCGLAIEVREGHVVSTRGDADDPFSRGHICPKGVALQDLHEDPDRLRTPLRRTGSGWEPAGWDEALDEAAEGLARVQKASGRDAVAVYLGNPTVHDHGALLFVPILHRALKTRSRFSATSVDQLPNMVAAYLMFGSGMLLPVPDLDRTELLVVFGANPVASNGSLMTAPGVGSRLAAIRRRGGRVVVFDPRRTETAEAASEHHSVRPGTDALLLLALLHEAFRAGAQPGRLEGFTDGLERLRELVAPFPAARVEGPTGVPAAVIRRLAHELASGKPAVCYGRTGTATQAFGGLCQWLVNALNVVTGNLDREGGALFPRPAFDLLRGPRPLTAPMRGFARSRTRVRGLPEFARELPVAVLADEVLTPGEGRIRALVTFAGNPVLSTPNGAKLDRALASLDFMVSIDPWLNETTRHARLVLPPSTPLERSHFDIAFNALAVREVARWSPPVFPPPPGAWDDWRILLELSRRLVLARDGFSLGAAATYAALAQLGPDGVLDLGLRFGPRGPGANPFADGLTLDALRRAPHGLDLGPLGPSLPERLATPSRRIDLVPAPFATDLSRLEAAFPPGAVARAEELLLIGRRDVRDNNSWMHNVPRLMRGPSRCTLLVNPHDAARLGLADGVLAEVASRVGRVKAPVQVSDEVMPGVVSLPHGYGHGRDGVRLAVAQRHAGVSANDLTDDEAVDLLTGNAAVNGLPVRVTRAGRA